MVLRDDTTAELAIWGGTLERRRYLLQNWRADVTTLVSTLGEPVEWYRYTAYGTPTAHPTADVNGDGAVNSADITTWNAMEGGDSSGAVWHTPDLNRDDVYPDQSDEDFFLAQHAAASAAVTAGSKSGYQSQGVYNLRKGYAGYEWDGVLAMWHVRHRVLDSTSGKWTRRDPVRSNISGSYFSGHTSELFPMSFTVVVIPGLPLGDPPIPPSCGNTISQTEWDKAIRHWRIALSACGVAPSVTCAPCARGVCGSAAPSARGRSCQVTICTTAPAGCGSTGSTLIHEFTHCRQGCDAGQPIPQPGMPVPGITYEERICREVEAYDVDGSCARSGFAVRRCLCQRACGSVGGPPLPCFADCMALLTSNRCRGGHYV